MVDRCRSGICTDIQQHADADYGKGGISEISQRNSIRNCRGYSLRLEDRTKGIEEPTMTVVYVGFENSDPIRNQRHDLPVDLLGILFLHIWNDPSQLWHATDKLLERRTFTHKII